MSLARVLAPRLSIKKKPLPLSRTESLPATKLKQMSLEGEVALIQTGPTREQARAGTHLRQVVIRTIIPLNRLNFCQADDFLVAAQHLR
jgi:hypothetical protein